MAKFISLLALVVFIIGCSKGNPSFSLSTETENFEQSSQSVNTKIDILWVIDNSGSMLTSQQQLTASFQSFINDFQTKNYDFHMAVTTTEAYRAIFTGNNEYARFRDGANGNHSGVFVMDSNTPNLEDVFVTNAMQGTSGYGDERAFSSFREALNSNLNAGFLRSDSFLAIIIVSDEDDFSHNSSWFTENYSYSGLHTAQSYVDYLDQLTNSTGSARRYNVSAIAIFDEDCRQELNNTFTGRKIGVRYGELIDLTEGSRGSLCEDFDVTLDNIASSVISEATEFYLSRIPDVDSIEVFVDGVKIPRIYDPQTETNGWYYNADANSIKFYGNVTPAQGSSIDVQYDPISVGQ